MSVQITRLLLAIIVIMFLLRLFSRKTAQSFGGEKKEGGKKLRTDGLEVKDVVFEDMKDN